MAHHPTAGGTVGHIFRRIVHVLIALIPIIYYQSAAHLTHLLGFSVHYIVVVVLLLSIAFEIWRLRKGIILPGHREHERTHPASFFWGSISICLVLLLVPGGTPHGEAYALPIIWGCAFADPIIGELRSRDYPFYFVAPIGMLVICLVWWYAALMFGISFWWGLLMAPVTVAAEWPKVRYIDDNMTMMLVPLLLVLLIV